MSKQLVSVIIPIYNAEKYLSDCLRSVMEQSYRNLEILLINDGSTDNSYRKCVEYAAKDSRIRVFDKENGGVSTARNMGLSNARGEYVLFIDSDDMIHRDYVRVCMELADEMGVDLFTFPIMQVISKEMSQRYSYLNEEKKEQQFIVRDKKESYLTMANMRNYWDFSAIGGKVIALKAIGSLRFDENMHYGEDTLFIQMLINSGIVTARGNEKWYLYRMHEQNAIKTKYLDKKPEYIMSHLKVAEREYQEGRKESAYYWQKMIYEMAYEGYIVAKTNKNKKMIRQLKSDMKKVSKSPSVNVNSISRRIEIYIYSYSPFWASIMSKLLISVRRKRICRK